MGISATNLRTWTTLLVAAALLLGGASAQASPFRWIGWDTSAISGMNADIVWGESAGVLFTNPALMPRFKPHTGIEYVMYKPNFEVKLGERPANADVSMMYYEADVSAISGLDQPYKALATGDLLNARADTNVDDVQHYLVGGFTHDFNLPGFRIGATGVLPLADSIDVNGYYADEREQFFTNRLHLARFGEWPAVVGGIVGAAYAYKNWISVGVAVQITASMVTQLGIFVPEATVQDYMLVNADASAQLKFRPIIGLQSEPIEQLAIGITWRNESYIDLGGSGELNMWNLHESPADVGEQTIPKPIVTDLKMAFDYEPMEVSAGVGGRYKDWKIQVGMTWERWSQYRDIHAERPQDAAVFPRSNAGAPTIDGEQYKWSDTISTAFNTSYKYVSLAEPEFESTLKVGFAWHPSPVPPQTGRTNYVDCDTWGVSLGNRFDFGFGEDWQFYAEIGLQFWQMLSRTVYKDPNQIRNDFPDALVDLVNHNPISSAQGLQTNNPGFPSYEAGGWMIVTGASLHYEF